MVASLIGYVATARFPDWLQAHLLVEARRKRDIRLGYETRDAPGQITQHRQPTQSKNSNTQYADMKTTGAAVLSLVASTQAFHVPMLATRTPRTLSMSAAASPTAPLSDAEVRAGFKRLVQRVYYILLPEPLLHLSTDFTKFLATRVRTRVVFGRKKNIRSPSRTMPVLS